MNMYTWDSRAPQPTRPNAISSATTSLPSAFCSFFVSFASIVSSCFSIIFFDLATSACISLFVCRTSSTEPQDAIFPSEPSETTKLATGAASATLCVCRIGDQFEQRTKRVCAGLPLREPYVHGQDRHRSIFQQSTERYEHPKPLKRHPAG